MTASAPGRIVILNGAPRSGNSSIGCAVQESFERAWMNLGVDASVRAVTPERYRPGLYDLERDTARASPEACAQAIREALETGLAAPSAFERLAAADRTEGDVACCRGS